jgi:hypothetical protein
MPLLGRLYRWGRGFCTPERRGVCVPERCLREG